MIATVLSAISLVGVLFATYRIGRLEDRVEVLREDLNSIGDDDGTPTIN